ncbi:hypothetical protein HanIR_Chr05g0230181 [Helianthus annuus]|nr:hypothetical protein HanIR_Chr05g0230181 [Helianthus annuus]
MYGHPDFYFYSHETQGKSEKKINFKCTNQTSFVPLQKCVILEKKKKKSFDKNTEDTPTRVQDKVYTRI